MCGRFQLSVKGKEISERFNTEVHDEIHRPYAPGNPVPKGYNCAPMQWLPVILNEKPEVISYLRWGLVPFWAKDSSAAAKMINSRAESIHEKPTFRQAFAQRRCLVPANGFYEWKKGPVKQAYRFFLHGEALFAMAGIWESWRQNDGTTLQTFSIITTTANSLMAGIHERMPLILSRENEEIWLQENDLTRLQSLLEPFPASEMECYPVSAAVNAVARDDKSLVNRVAEQGELF